MAEEYIWINTGGESCCGKKSNHGGASLAHAVSARDWIMLDADHPQIFTSRDHWIGFDPKEIDCEYCRREEQR